MIRFNIFYWIIAPGLLLVLYLFSNQLKLSHKEYLGFVENKESEVNLDRDVYISKIFATTGQLVKKGELLIKVSNSSLDEEIQQLDVQLDGIQIKNLLNANEIKAEILELQQEKESKLAELNTKLSEVETEMEFYKQLSGSVLDKEIQEHPKEKYRNELRSEISKIRQEYNVLISHYQKMLLLPKETQTEKAGLEKQKNFLKDKQNDFDVVAPYDGIVGSINVREGEHVKSYSSLVTFLRPTPSMVIGYLQEKYIVNVMVGDSVTVESRYDANKKVYGVVSAIGNRIIEIPEKFRKIPDVKLYGLEVFIQIPEANIFLQKEITRVKPLKNE